MLVALPAKLAEEDAVGVVERERRELGVSTSLWIAPGARENACAKSATVASLPAAKPGEKSETPITPPFAAHFSNNASDLFRATSFSARGRQWVIAQGCSEYAIASAEVTSPTWLKSHKTPTRFISATISRPNPVRPESLSSR